MKPYLTILLAGMLFAGPALDSLIATPVRPDLLGSRKGFGKGLIGDASQWDEVARPLYSNTFTGVLVLRARRKTATAYFVLRHDANDRQKLNLNLKAAPRDLRMTVSRKTNSRVGDITDQATSSKGYRLSVRQNREARFLCTFESQRSGDQRTRRKLIRLDAVAMRSDKRDQIRVIVIY